MDNRQITGWKVWRPDPSGLLKAACTGAIWAPGEVVTDDFAWSTLDYALDYGWGPQPHYRWHPEPTVIGFVVLWGKVTPERRGYRAESARIRAFERFNLGWLARWRVLQRYATDLRGPPAHRAAPEAAALRG